MHKISMRKRPIEVVKAMIKPEADMQADWKFLIYDPVGEDILNSLMSVKELKYHGITLRLFIDFPRDPVPDVSAVYFVTATDKNVDQICRDIENHLYDSYYINFITLLSKQNLRKIANAAQLSDSAVNVKKIFSQQINFIPLEDNLFVLREREKDLISYHALHRHDSTDAEITAVIDYIVECLFSVLLTLRVVPIIRCPKGGPAEDVARKLFKMIQSALEDDRKFLFENKVGATTKSNRPLLCVVDRSIDMSTPLHHTWTYQALIHDLLNPDLNKVKIIEYDNESPKALLLDLNPDDKFWLEQKGTPFPQVADSIQQEIDNQKKLENEIKMNFEDPEDEDTLFSRSVTTDTPSLLELRENKRILAMHTTIATSVLKEIKTRKLDNFFEFEEKIMNQSSIDRSSFDGMVSDVDTGEPTDKYRLFLISYICDNPKLNDDEAEIYMNVLENLGCDRKAFEYLKQWKAFSKNLANLQSNLKSSGGGVLKTASMFSKLRSQGSQFVMAGVKNLVLKEHHLPLTKIIDNLMDCSSRPNRASSEYTYLDPKVERRERDQQQEVFQDAIVFVVGGGNYIEYQNLVDYCKSKTRTSPKNIVYGSTSLVNANQFLHQLGQVGAN